LARRRAVGLAVGPGLAIMLAMAVPDAVAQTALPPDASPDSQAVPLRADSSADTLPNIAEIRAELDSLSAELQALRGALRVSGAAGYAESGGASAIERMDRMEARLRSLTGIIEETRNNIEQIARDSTTLLDDLEFRLCQ